MSISEGSSSSRQVKCRYLGCGTPFTSKHRLKEHVLHHLRAEPPKRVSLHARIRYEPRGGFRIIEDLSAGIGHGKAERTSMEMEVDEDGLDEARTEAALGQEDEVEGFRMSDIFPSDSQVGNITTTTTTTTTTGGTTSQPIPFSPYLPDRPSGISLPTQSQSPLRAYRSQPYSSPVVQLAHGHRQRHRHESVPHEPLTPFIHTAPSGSASSTQSSARRPAQASGARSPQSASRPVSRRSPFNPPSPLQSSTPLNERQMLRPSQSQSQSQPSQSQSQSSQSQIQKSQSQPSPSRIVPPPPSAQPQHPPGSPSNRQVRLSGGLAKRDLSFGEALSPTRKSRKTADTTSGVTFGFGQ